MQDPRQFTWRLHAIVVILARLVAAWFMQRDGKAGIYGSNNILRGGIRSIATRAHCLCCMCSD
jgi:hypothetical protein